VDKDIETWKQRNEILHKKVNRQMAEIKDLNKKSETIFDLARQFPNKTYRELEKYRDADRQEEADQIPLTESQKSPNSNLLQDELDRVKKENNDLFLRIAELTEVEESHRKMNSKMQMRITELEQDNLEVYADNKKISRQISDKVERARKAGL